MAHDKASLDIFCLRDETPADSDNLLPPDVIVAGDRGRPGGGVGAFQVDCQ